MAKDLAPQVEGNSLVIQVQHHHHHHGGDGNAAGAAAAGAALGFFLGAVIANEAQRQQAIEYCARRYRSYDPQSMTYLGRNGVRYRCP
jgi:BA14K-like protein